MVKASLPLAFSSNGDRNKTMALGDQMLYLRFRGKEERERFSKKVFLVKLEVQNSGAKGS